MDNSVWTYEPQKPCNAPKISDRDWFAAHADLSDANLTKEISERLAGTPMPGLSSDPIAVIQWAARVNARLRYIMADAMLAERSRK